MGWSSDAPCVTRDFWKKLFGPVASSQSNVQSTPPAALKPRIGNPWPRPWHGFTIPFNRDIVDSVGRPPRAAFHPAGAKFLTISKDPAVLLK
jgi:hypothetical protein